MSDAEVVEGTLVLLPSLGADMDVGSVLEWRVDVGDRIERGDVIALVSTEKSDIDVESWDAGVVTELIATIGEEIDVGTPLQRLDGNGSASGEPLGRAETNADPPASAEAEGEEPTRGLTAGGVRSSPLARRLAAARQVSLDGIEGTGPGGAVVAADIEQLVTAGEPPTTPDDAPASAMRRAIADRMSRSNREIPHYHLDRDIDMTSALAWMAELNADRPVADRIVAAALLTCATARAARAIGELNGTWEDGRFIQGDSVDLALVVSLRSGGLVTPTIVDADQLDASTMMAIMRDMVSRARRGQLLSRWMKPSSIAMTNLGDNGADRVGGVIFPPHVALVGFGRISDRPWVVDGAVVARPIVTATVAADHRASDGAAGSRFLAAVAEILTHPEQLGS